MTNGQDPDQGDTIGIPPLIDICCIMASFLSDDQ